MYIHGGSIIHGTTGNMLAAACEDMAKIMLTSGNVLMDHSIEGLLIFHY
jgi:hypothetical protein